MHLAIFSNHISYVLAGYILNLTVGIPHGHTVVHSGLVFWILLWNGTANDIPLSLNSDIRQHLLSACTIPSTYKQSG
jgi:hypothetical protein